MNIVVKLGPACRALLMHKQGWPTEVSFESTGQLYSLNCSEASEVRRFFWERLQCVLSASCFLLVFGA